MYDVNQLLNHLYLEANDANSKLFVNPNGKESTSVDDEDATVTITAFIDEYIDSRICPSVTNVSINIASEISAFGVGMVNPITAHTGYDNDERVINIISNGTSHIKENKTFSERCRFYELED